LAARALTDHAATHPVEHLVEHPQMKPLKEYLFLIAITIGTLVVTGCAGAAELQKGNGEQMKAIVSTEFGPPEVLRLEEIDRPVIKEDNQVLVRVRAAAVNPLDWHEVRGTPYFARAMGMGWRTPKNPKRGVDFAGDVVAVGKGVTKFKPGDAVFGVAPGSLAEYAWARETRIALKPESLSYEDAAAVPVAAVTALQSLRDAGKLEAGQKVLINGASGGVGTYGVQIAKAMGAEVTAVCSGRNAELVRSLGADHVIDYTKEDLAERPERYDLVIDNVGNRSLGDMRSVLADDGTFVLIGGGGPDDMTWGFGFVGGMIKRKVAGWFTDQTLTFMIASVKTADLEYLAGLMTEGKVKSVIDRRYPLAQTPDAIRYLETGRARGKVVINVE
jgi:NADPH:quinone reductase-like Zn-dependent oxidoreductase